MGTPFGEMLYQAIRRSGSSANNFAKRAGTSSGFLSNVYSGKRRPPLERLPEWAGLLELDEDQRQQFIMLGNLMHCPPKIQEAFHQQEAELADLRQKMPGDEGPGSRSVQPTPSSAEAHYRA